MSEAKIPELFICSASYLVSKPSCFPMTLRRETILGNRLPLTEGPLSSALLMTTTWGTAQVPPTLFDLKTGQQLRKLLPNDGKADNIFGNAVDIDGTTAVVGARLARCQWR